MLFIFSCTSLSLPDPGATCSPGAHCEQTRGWHRVSRAQLHGHFLWSPSHRVKLVTFPRGLEDQEESGC